MEFDPQESYDFAFFDSGSIREFARFHPSLEIGAVVVFQTAVSEEDFKNTLNGLVADGVLTRSFFNVPRGLFVGRVAKIPPTSGQDTETNNGNLDRD